ncbi:MAG: hypothetical protein IJJ26_10620 [Victivallales bacterium]|nr:hypothetical protein [Victivallales bacterium]
MLEAKVVEAIQAAQAPQTVAYLQQLQEAEAVADPNAVQAFQQAMNVKGPDPVPFAQRINQAWHAAQDMNQDIIHRIHALSERKSLGPGPSVAMMTELQYEVANLSFQQEVVTNVAKKASSAIETLVKNG